MPPHCRLDYPILYAIPPVILSFSCSPEFDIKQHGNAKTHKIIDRAIDEALNRGSTDFMISPEYEWKVRPMYLTLDPNDRQRAANFGDRPRYVALTWGIWTNALLGLQRFTTMYPRLDFDFAIQVHEGGAEKLVIAKGELREYDLGRPGDLDALSACLQAVDSDKASECLAASDASEQGQVSSY